MPASSSSLHPSPETLTHFWNDTPLRTYLFDAFSVVLPEGERFLMNVARDAAPDAQAEPALAGEVDRFLKEEATHQRAHRQYNRRLADQGYDVDALERRVAHDLQEHVARWSLPRRLSLASAFEHLTMLVSEAALRSPAWLSESGSVQSRVWQWHCREEIEHRHVMPDLLVHHRVGHALRIATFLLATLLLMFDLCVHIRSFYRTDLARGRVSRMGFWTSVAAFLWQGRHDGLRLAGGWLAYLLPPSGAAGGTDRPAPQGPVTQPGSGVPSAASRMASDMRRLVAGLWHPSRPHAQTHPVVRALQATDLPALMDLETQKWDADQSAPPEALRQRMAAHPALCLGAFCPRTGQALASLFMKPVCAQALQHTHDWQSCVNSSAGATNDLFGISLSSRDPEATHALLGYFWPRALKAGWRRIYLGSPVPGLRSWLHQNPGQDARTYAHLQRNGLPLDPQLRYYHRRGFKRIVAVRPNYFPHPASLDHGVLLEGRIPLARMSWLWQHLPLRWLIGMQGLLFKLL